MNLKQVSRAGIALVLGMTATAGALASSHREAPFITEVPKVDGTDFYMFRSYESGRAGYVTLIANYLPLQDAYGGPNYFALDPDALYEIHLSNDGDANEEITFQFRFNNAFNPLTLNVGPEGNTRAVQIPLIAHGAVSGEASPSLGMQQTYTVSIVRGDRRTGTRQSVTRVGGGAFNKPVDNIGNKTIADYPAYAAAHVYDVSIPGCTAPASTSPRVFVGQRAEGFAVNLGQIFDLVNADFDDMTPAFNPIGAQDQGLNTVGNKNVTSIAVEVPISCLTAGSETVIGGWTTASLRQARLLNPAPTGPVASSAGRGPAREGGAWTQVSRLGMPLVNEVVIGLNDKDLFNASHPRDDGQFADYVTHPTLPELLEILFGEAGVSAPNNFPRSDLVAAFLTGVGGVNQPAGIVASEMLRLNTALPVTAADAQVTYGAALCFDRTESGGMADPMNEGCDLAGFPNGRRPADDVVDIALRVAMGYLAPTGDAASGGLPFADGAFAGSATSFLTQFPYLNHPTPGSP
jgi:hypothetical protein